MKIAVYTANFNDKDKLLAPINYQDNPNIDYFVFVDTVQSEKVYPYSQIMVDISFDDITKNARKIKILGHAVLNNYDMLIWHDSNIQLNMPYLDELIQLSLSKKTFITTFKHPDRNDFYSEAMTCVRVKKDNHIKILKQVKHYFFGRLPAHNGLYSTGVLIKNTSHYDKEFLNFWWHQTLTFSRRDQLSLAYAIFKTKSEINCIEDNIFNNKYLKYHNHNHNLYLVKNKAVSGNRFWLFSFYSIKLMRKLRKML